MPIIDTEISNLNPIPSSWSELEVENFIKNRCKFPAADPDVDTYNCSYSELFKYANSAINQNSTSIAGALSVQQKMLGGVTSIWYVDADNGLDTNDGKSIAYSFKTLDKALSSVSACNLIFITSSTAITYSITSDVTLPNNTYIISNSPLVNISLSSVSFGTDSAIYIKGSLTIGNINLSSKLILSSRDLTLTSTHIGSNANIILAADTVTLGCTINGKVSVKSSSLYLVNNVILSDSYINVSFLYLGTSGYSYVTGSCHIRCDTVYNTPKENGSLIVTSGKLYVNINRVESSSTATWLMCTTILGNTASVVGFIGEEVDSNISYSGLGVADIRVTYAGEKYGSVIYDAVCNTQEDLQEALNDSSVHSVYLRYPLTALGTPTTYKYFYGETILWNISTANLIKFYNVCTLLDNVTFNTVYFSDVNASISKTVTASTLGYYERRSNIECINVSQKYWNTSVPNASYTEKGVVKLNSDFLIEDDGTISLSSKSLAKRFVYGTYTSPSYFIGQGTVSENYGTTTLTCTSAGIIKIGSDIDFLILTINISSTHTTSNELQWFESQIQIGYWSNSTFTVVKTLSKEHTNDSGSIDDSFSYVIDVSKIIGNELGIKYISNYDIDSSSYSVCLVQTGTSVNGSGEASDHLVLATSTDTIPGNLFAKITASGMAKISDNESTIDISSALAIDSTLAGTGETSSPLGLANPLYYVKGNSIYGGTLTDNLDTLTRNTPFTCLGTATGAPSADYSWFGWHINSNAGTAAAAQIAYAFNSNAIICYERVKTSDTWGAWTLRPVRGVWPVQTFSAGTLTATAGILYKGTAIANLTLALAAQEGGEYHIKFSTASTIGTFDLSAITHWIGTAPTIAAGKTYELDILDGVGVIAEVS